MSNQWWDELAERRALLSSSQGVSGETDDRLRDLDIREAPLDPNLKGKQGGLGQQGPMMPPMMMGGAGGKGAAAPGMGAPAAAAAAPPAGASSGVAPSSLMGASPVARATPPPAAAPPAPLGGGQTAGITPGGTGGGGPAGNFPPPVAGPVAPPSDAVRVAEAATPDAVAGQASVRTGEVPAAGLGKLPDAGRPHPAQPASPGYTVDPLQMNKTASSWESMGARAKSMAEVTSSLQTNFGLLKTAEESHRELTSKATSWASGASQEFDSLQAKLVDASRQYQAAEELSQEEAGRVI